MKKGDIPGAAGNLVNQEIARSLRPLGTTDLSLP